MCKRLALATTTLTLLLAVVGCQTTIAKDAGSTAATTSDGEKLVTKVEDGRLWVLKQGQKKSDKHITLIGQGPKGMTVKALDRKTALQFLAQKPGFHTEVEEIVEDRYVIWALKPGQEKSAKHVSLIGVGPAMTTVKAPDKATAYAYLASKPGFDVKIEQPVEDQYVIWALKPGDEISAKHMTLIGMGPAGLSVKAVDKETALEYVAKKQGFDVEAEEIAGGVYAVWVLEAGQKKSGKHITLIGAGPMGITIKGVDRETLMAYRAAAM